MSTNFKSVTDASFEQDVLQSELPVLVDYWAEWCAPCKMLMPVLEEISTQYQGKVNFVKMDVASNQETPAKYNIRGIPALILYKDGNAIATHVGGNASKSQLAAFIDNNLS